MKKIIFSALALAAVSMAGAQTVRNLVVTDKDGVTREFPADQIDGIIFQEAPEYVDLTQLLVTNYEESGNSGMYHIEFGTSEPDASGDPLNVGDMQVALLLQGPQSADLTNPVLPAGYYGIGNSTSDYTFDVNRSAVWVRSEEGPDGVAPLMIMNGTVDVRIESEGMYDIRMELVTLSGEIDLRYQGPVPFEGGYSAFEPFTEPVEVDFTGAQGRFYGNWFYPFSADLNAQFFVGNIEDGYLKDGYILTLDFNEPKPEDCMAPGQRVADGTYTVETREAFAYTYLPFRFNKGRITDFMGQPFTQGTYLQYIAPTGHRKQGLITDGSFTVSENGTKFEFNFVTEEGVSITGTYQGVPNIGNYCDNDEKEPQRPYSTLTEDVVLEWVPETMALTYNEGHSILDNANTLVVMVTDPAQAAGDYIMFDLLTESAVLEDGTYTVDRTLEPGHIYPGTVDFGGSPMFAWYGDLDTTDGEGYQTILGPIESGTITVTTLADGQKKIEFNVADDNGHSITGNYIGTVLDITDFPTEVSKHKKAANRNIKSRKLAVRK